ncbi:hypothetical protein Prudu_1440S001600 [Prunus dulcis]|uniref:VASt domain-containing protein n=1 Tax=Prunus dulcis TaxID=3755 RepID=A0A5H2XWN6_PRUDU|nr:hypothetical protein Prudu_1440S001600 [Prunus dulcis]
MGRVRYKFASFWNRNHAFRGLHRTEKNYHAMLEAEKKCDRSILTGPLKFCGFSVHKINFSGFGIYNIKFARAFFQREKAASALRAHSSSVKGSQAKIPEDIIPKTGKLPAFIKEEVITSIYNDVFPCTAEKFFNLLLSDGSNYLHEYRSARKDTNLVIGQWHPADEYDGQLREITFRCICNSPMCPPDTAMTEWQHAVLSPDKKTLVFETVQQAHDVPFGSYFERTIKTRVVKETTTNSTEKEETT